MLIGLGARWSARTELQDLAPRRPSPLRARERQLPRGHRRAGRRRSPRCRPPSTTSARKRRSIPPRAARWTAAGGREVARHGRRPRLRSHRARQRRRRSPDTPSACCAICSTASRIAWQLVPTGVERRRRWRARRRRSGRCTAGSRRPTATGAIRSPAAATSIPVSTSPPTSGKPVYATADGIVDAASLNGNYGNLVVIDHGFGIVDALRPPVALRRDARPAGQARRRHRLRRIDRPRRPARTCTTKCWVNGQLTNPLRLLGAALERRLGATSPDRHDRPAQSSCVPFQQSRIRVVPHPRYNRRIP